MPLCREMARSSADVPVGAHAREQFLHDRVQLTVGLGDCDAGLETSDDTVIVASAFAGSQGAGVQTSGGASVPIRPEECGNQDVQYQRLIGRAAEINSSADDRRIAVKNSLPERIAENRD